MSEDEDAERLAYSCLSVGSLVCLVSVSALGLLLVVVGSQSDPFNEGGAFEAFARSHRGLGVVALLGGLLALHALYRLRPVMFPPSVDTRPQTIQVADVEPRAVLKTVITDPVTGAVTTTVIEFEAQSTAGSVYVLSSSHFPGVVKVGRTQRSAAKRAKEIAAGIPVDFHVDHEESFDDPIGGEREVLRELEPYRVNGKREVFRCSIAEAIRVVRRAKARLEGPGR